MTKRHGSMTTTRRSFLQLATGSVATGILAAPFVRRAVAQTPESEGVIVVNDSGGTTSEAFHDLFFRQFTQDTGIEVRIASTSSSPEAFAKLKAANEVNNVEWDVVATSSESMITQRQYIDTIDCDTIPDAADAFDGACVDTGLLRFSYGEINAYNTEVFKPGSEPQTWADFWDVERFPGPRGMGHFGVPWVTLAIALMADGVPAETAALYPLDVDRAFKKLDEIKPHIAVWWRTGAQLQQILRDREVVMANGWSGRVTPLINEGQPIAIQWNQAIISSDFWSPVKGRPHPKATEIFFNYMAGHPDRYADFARRTGYLGPNSKVVDHLSQEERNTLAIPDTATTVQHDYNWVTANRDKLVERFNSWLAL